MPRPTMTVRDFRAGFASLTEPTDVGPSPTGPKGTWFPGGHECDGDDEAQANLGLALRKLADADAEVARLKRELAKGHAGEPLPPATGGYSRQGDLAVRGILGKLSTGRKGRD